MMSTISCKINQERIEKNPEEMLAGIFTKQWMITAPRKWTIEPVDMTYYGVRTYENPMMDMEMMEEWTKTTRSIATLAEWHAEGKEFQLLDINNAQAMFNIIIDYTEYVAMTLGNKIHLTYVGIEKNPEVQEVLTDLVKLQNLANRLFPVMVRLEIENPSEIPQQSGLFSYLTDVDIFLGKKLEFDPYQKYGFSRQLVTNKELRDKETGLFKAVDVERYFDPSALGQIKKVI